MIVHSIIWKFTSKAGELFRLRKLAIFTEDEVNTLQILRKRDRNIVLVTISGLQIYSR